MGLVNGALPSWCRLVATMLGMALGLTLDTAAMQSPVFRASAELVVVHAVVLSDERSAAALSVEDFRITVDGDERPISVFSRPESGPGEFIVAVDVSGSMAAWPAQEATNLLLDSLHDGSCVLLFTFRESPLGGVWGHPDDSAVRSRVAEIEFKGEEGIFDALLVAFGRMRERIAADGSPPGSAFGDPPNPTLGELARFRRSSGAFRWEDSPAAHGECSLRRSPWDIRTSGGAAQRAIIVVTDGVDHSSLSSIEDVLMMAWGSGFPVFMLVAESRASSGGVGSMGRPSHYGTMRSLERLTEFTGGVVFRGVKRPPEHQKVWTQLQRLIGSLQAHYVLGYVPVDGDESSPFVDRRKLKVEVSKAGYKVLAQSHVVRGRAADGAAARDLVLRGFSSIAADLPAQAIQSFDAALTAEDGLGWAHYGRGISLAMMSETSAALEALQQAALHEPWLPDLDARLAELLVETGDLVLAWRHALKAHAAGAEVETILMRLQELAPRDVDLSGSRNPASVQVQAAGGGDLPARTVAPVILQAVGRAVWASQLMVVAGEAEAADLVLSLRIDEVRRRGAGYSMSGWLVLSDPEGRTLRDLRLNITDIDNAAQRNATVMSAFKEIEAAVSAYLAG